MKKLTLLLTLLFTASAPLVAPFGFAADGHNHSDASKIAPAAQTGKLIPLAEEHAAWAAKARKSYPLDVCLTSDEKLGSMGKSPEYIYRIDGKPDRLVVFCCGGCEEDFMKDPAQYLAKLDTAAKVKSTPAPKAAAPKGHGDHKH